MKKVFHGVINGIEYDNVAEYNKALADALSGGGPISVKMTYEDVPDEERKIEQEMEDYDKFVCDHNMLPDFDLDLLTGDNCHDSNLIEAAEHDAFSETHMNEILKSAELLHKGFRDKYVDDVADILACTISDIEDNERAKAKIHTALAESAKIQKDLEARLKTESDRQDRLDAQLNICKNASIILARQQEFYDAIQKRLKGELPAGKAVTREYDSKYGKIPVTSRITKPDRALAPVEAPEGKPVVNGRELGRGIQLTEEQMDVVRKLWHAIIGVATE